jgi:hypothetical protein
MQLLVCASYDLVVFIIVASCSSSGGDAESNVFISLVHARTHTQKKKKKIALVIRGLSS